MGALDDLKVVNTPYPTPGEVENVSLTSTITRVALPTNARIVSMYGTVPYEFVLGNSEVSIADFSNGGHKVPASIVIISVRDDAFISVRRIGDSNGTLNMGRLE